MTSSGWMEQLKTLSPGEILSSSDMVWIDEATGYVRVHVDSRLVDSRDGHLGYTQIVRLAEIARFVSWKQLLNITSGNRIQDCTVILLEARFRKPIKSGQVIELPIQ